MLEEAYAPNAQPPPPRRRCTQRRRTLVKETFERHRMSKVRPRRRARRTSSWESRRDHETPFVPKIFCLSDELSRSRLSRRVPSRNIRVSVA